MRPPRRAAASSGRTGGSVVDSPVAASRAREQRAALARDASRQRCAREGRVRKASAREGKAKLLLDVPGLELDATVQVHREAGADEERLDDQHRADIDVSASAGDPASVAVEAAARATDCWSSAGRTSHASASRHQRQRRNSTIANAVCIASAAPRCGPRIRATRSRARLAALAFELQHRLHVRAPRRQAAQRQRAEQAPATTDARAPRQRSAKRVLLAEHGARRARTGWSDRARA